MATELNYPANIADISEGAASSDDAIAYIRFNILKRSSARAVEYEGGVNLFFPASLNTQLSASYDGVAMGRGGTGTDIRRGLTDMASNSIETLVNGMSSKLYGGSQASPQDITDFKNKTVLNPFMKMLFRNVGFRSMEFTFKFTPKSQKDCNTIFQIIQTFRSAMLPSGDTNGSNKLGYPNEVTIQSRYQGRPHPWLPSYKTCVITDVNVNYAASGAFIMMRNGFPAESELTIQLMEIELLNKDDISIENGPSF